MDGGPQHAEARRKSGSILSGDPDSAFQIGLTRYYVPFLFHPIVSAAVVVAVLAAAAAGAVAITSLKEGLKLSDLAPDEHYVQDFATALSVFESQVGVPSDLYFRNCDQSDPDVQRRMLATWSDALESYSYLDAERSPRTSWLTAFHAWVAANASTAAFAGTDGTVAQPPFYSLLNDFFTQEVLCAVDLRSVSSGCLSCCSSRLPCFPTSGLSIWRWPQRMRHQLRAPGD